MFENIKAIFNKLFNSLKTKNKMDLTKLSGVIPENIIAMIPNIIDKFEINNPLRLSHFLANISNETGNFTVVEENLYYTSPGLIATWGTLFNSTNAADYAMKPEKIANRAYGNRMGNGDEASGDGWKYRGRGFIQLTGKENYKRFSDSIGDDCVLNPDLVATKYPMDSAAYFWQSNGVNVLCDGGSDQVTINIVRKRVNGGLIGVERVTKLFNIIYPLLS